jgi:uncharacterized membrane protein YraQ (UPF0718 family)
MTSGIIYFALSLILLITLFLKDKAKAYQSLKISWETFKKIAPVLLAVFILVGLFEVFISSDFIINFLSSFSSLSGVILADVIGSILAGHPSASYIIGNYLQGAGVAASIIAAFVVSWVLVNIIGISIEIKIFGRRFAFWRNFISFIAAALIGIITGLIL